MIKRHLRWTLSDTLRAETDLLDSVLPLEGSYTVFNVALPAMSHPQQRFLSTLRISPEESPQIEVDQGYRSIIAGSPPAASERLPPILLLHGFAAGKAMWFRLLPYLRGANRGREVYAVDLPGMGANAFTREERLWLQKGLKACATPEERAEHAARYYVEAVEGWRIAMKIERVLLVGHSFGAVAHLASLCLRLTSAVAARAGALMAAHYARAHPDRVSQLILLSPVGLAPTAIEPGVQATPKVSLIDRIIGGIWARYHVTPLQMARCVGHLLPSVVRSFVKKSTLFRSVTDKEQIAALSRYVYGVVRSRSSADVLMCHIVGECALVSCMLRMLITPVTSSGAAGQSATSKPLSLNDLARVTPTHVFIGENDWVTGLSGERQGWQRTDVAEVGHCMHIERPEAVWEVLRQYPLGNTVLMYHECQASVQK